MPTEYWVTRDDNGEARTLIRRVREEGKQWIQRWVLGDRWVDAPGMFGEITGHGDGDAERVDVLTDEMYEQSRVRQEEQIRRGL